MSLPSNQILTLEAIIYGLINAGGSNTRNTVNVFHYSTPPSAAAKLKTDINAHFQSTVLTPLAAALNLRWSAQHTTIRFPDDATDAPMQFPATYVGLMTGDSMPMHNSVYLLLRTGLRGKNYRGSKKFGPLSESDTAAGTDDILDAAAIARWQAVLTAVVDPFTDGSGVIWTPCILSRKLSQLKINPTTVVSNVITQGLLKKSIGRLKKREPKSVY